MRNTKQNLERPSSRDTVFVFATLAVKGGAWNRQKELLRFLTVRGWTVHLIAVDNPDLQSLRTIEGAHIHAVGEFGRTGTFEFTLSVLRTLWQMDLTRYERIWFGSFAGNSGVGLALYKAFSSLPIQMFTFLRGSELDRLLAKSSRGNPYWEMKIRAHKSAASLMLRQSELLLTQTPLGQRQLEAIYSSLPCDRVVVPNNLNASWIKNKIRKLVPSQTDDRAFGADSFRVCFVGRIDFYIKGVDTLLEAAMQVEHDSIVFDVVGDGKDYEALKNILQKRQLADKFRLYGWLENPMEIIAAADLVVVPSRIDDCPNVVLEALAMSKPVIGASVGGIKMMLEYDALLFPAGDSVSFAQMLQRAASDEAFYRELKKHSAERAKLFEFNWGKRFYEALSSVE